ncbi:MAG: UDP-3-O-(3-hydroxymyristoyl)glucosamine N-acyltransferase, partial [Planctomycetota bacterium]
MRLEALAAELGVELVCPAPEVPEANAPASTSSAGSSAAGGVEVTGCATLEDAGASEVSFLANPRYVERACASAAAAVFCDAKRSDALLRAGRRVLVAGDPYFAFRQATVRLHGFRAKPSPGPGFEATPAGAQVHASAVVDPSAELGEGVYVGPNCVVMAGARVGAGSVLWSQVTLMAGSVVGGDCDLYPQVVVYDRCVLGDRVTLHAGCVIGQDGFGYATALADGDDRVRHHKIPPAGRAVIGDDVEMGAGCSVDRATLGDTVIGEGTKFSNTVTIGHGCKVGRFNLFVAQVGLAGSTVTGDYVVLGGQVGVAGHLRIGHRVQVAGSSKVATDLPDIPLDQVGTEDGRFGGTPAIPLAQAKRSALMQRKLPDMASQLRALRRRVAELERRR